MNHEPWIEEYIACDCHTEGLLLSYMPDDVDDPEAGFVYVSLWAMRPGNVSWRYRLHHIWRILRSGRPYRDDVVLTQEGVERLHKFCEAALAGGMYCRPWMVTYRSGECVTVSSIPTTVIKAP